MIRILGLLIFSLRAVIRLHECEDTALPRSSGKDQMAVPGASHTSRDQVALQGRVWASVALYFYSPAGKKGTAGVVCGFENSCSLLVARPL